MSVIMGRPLIIAMLACLCASPSYSTVCKTTTETTLKDDGIPDTPCVIPFVYKEQSWNGCKRDNKGRYWCSTKTENGTNEHVKGNWGYCVEECDGSCKDQETCQDIGDCPVVQAEFERFKTLKKKEQNILKRKLKSLICHKKPRKVCCPVSKATTEISLIKSSSYPSSCQADPVSNFRGDMLPERGECGVSCNGDSQRVVGGENAKLGEFPWAALLGTKIQIKKFDFVQNKNVAGFKIKYTCGGTLINTWYVLTAAHCQKNVHQVVLGEWEVSEGDLTNKDPDCAAGGIECMPKVQKILVDKVIADDEYRRTRKGIFNDIALIRLKTEAVLNRAVQMACLPLNSVKIAEELNLADLGNGLEGYNSTVIGWGHTASFDEGDLDTHGVAKSILQKGVIPLWSIDRCKDNYNEGRITDHLCAGAGDNGVDSCNGDSGGGLFVRKNTTDMLDGDLYGYVQVGIVSYGSAECGDGSPGVYTRVSEYIQWIRDNIEE